MSDGLQFVLASIVLPLLIASVPVLAGYWKWRSDRRRLSDESVAAIEAKRADAAQSISQAADSVIRNIRAAYDQALAELGVARAARREVEEKLGKLVVEHAKVQDQLKVLNAKVVVLEDNNRQLRERVSALEADNHRLAEENRRLRESAEGNA